MSLEDVSWHVSLVEDAHECIRQEVRAGHDVASALALGLTCRSEMAAFQRRYKLSVRSKHVVTHAAASGHVQLMWWAAAVYKMDGNQKKLMETAAWSAIEHNQLAVLDSLANICQPATDDKSRVELLCMAARRGHLAAFHWLIAHHWVHGAALGDSALWGAVGEGGSVPILQWLVGERHVIRPVPIWPDCALLSALRANQMVAVQWLWTRFRVRSHDSGVYLSAAARSGCKDALDWLLARGCRINLWVTVTVVVDAIYSLSLPMVQYVVSLGCPVAADSADRAALCGRADMVQWLYDTTGKCVLGDPCARLAAETDDVAFLDWLMARECAVDFLPAMATAARHNNIPILSRLCEWADRRGRLLIAFEQRVLMKAAIIARCRDAVRYLSRVRMLPWPRDALHWWEIQADTDDLVWLLKQGCPA